MKITGSIKVSAEPEIRAPSRGIGNAKRIGVGEKLKLAPLQSLPKRNKIYAWSILSGDPNPMAIVNTNGGQATYTARDVTASELAHGKKEFSVVLVLKEVGGGEIARVEIDVTMPTSANLLKLGPRHSQGTANSGFWGIWVMGPKDVSFMNLHIKESRGTLVTTGKGMEHESGKIHKISGGVSHVDYSGQWMDSFVVTALGTVFDAIDNVWTPATAPASGWRDSDAPWGTVSWPIAQSYRLKTAAHIDKGCQYTNAVHEASVSYKGDVTTKKGGAEHKAKITDPTINNVSWPAKGTWGAEIPQEIKDKFP